MRRSEHFLDDAEVRPAFDEVGGERVTEGVGGDFLVDTCGHGLVLDDAKDIDAAEGTAVPVQEQDVLVGAGSRFGPGRKIVPDGLGGHFPQGDNALLVAFAHDIDIALVQVDVRDLETGALTHAEAASVQDLQDGAIPQACRVPGVHRGDDGVGCGRRGCPSGRLPRCTS